MSQQLSPRRRSPAAGRPSGWSPAGGATARVRYLLHLSGSLTAVSTGTRRRQVSPVRFRPCPLPSNTAGARSRSPPPSCCPPRRRARRPTRARSQAALPRAAPPNVDRGQHAGSAGRAPRSTSRPGAPVLPKELSARSWIVADAESGDVLAAHNAHWRLAPASTLKMLFADTLLPKLPKRRRPQGGGPRTWRVVGCRLQPGRDQGERDLHRPRPVARRLPALGQRRRARAVGDERRRQQTVGR
ncbi:hypothetical protein SANTM175S_07173 [Streptomyces antimycoticus]